MSQINQTFRYGAVLNKVIPVLLFLIGLYYFCFRILGLGLEFIPGDLGDSRFINYLLEHAHLWITGNESSFWDAEFMYPFKNSIALSDNMIGSVPFYSIWRLSGFGMETSYQLWWLCMSVFNYWVCYLVLRKWNQSVLIAAILSWIFAFSFFNIGQLNYMQMIVRFMVPVVFYAAYRLVTSPSPKYLAWYCFAIVLQLYCVVYTGIYAFYFSLLFIFILLVINKNFKTLFFYFTKSQLKFTLPVLIVAVMFSLILMIPYQEMSKTVGLRMFREVTPNLPTAGSFLLPQESSIFWHFLFQKMSSGVKEYWLHYLFPGMLMLLTLLISPLYLLYRKWKKQPLSPLISAVIVTAFLIALLHLHFGNNITLYALIFKLPGINSIRVPIRFMHVELFLLVFVFGAFLTRFKPLFITLFFVVVFADNMFNPELMPRNVKLDLVRRHQMLKNEIESKMTYKTKLLAVVDTGKAAFITHLDAMIVAQSLRVKTINGYSSYCHDNFGEYFNKCNTSGLNKWLAFQNIDSSAVFVLDKNK